ncbi:Bbp16 family capsid cement protein [Bartonella sp. OT172YNZD]|uniref:Bbp16 family capsid cement protein n=1 Tax=Bartonella sp. OT172YNZD TaxID=3243572 RepID=UPI0035D0000F
MITDDFLTLSEEQAVKDTAYSRRSIDLYTQRDIGEGKPLYMYFSIPQAFKGGTSVEFQLVIADKEDLKTGETVIGTTGAIVVEKLSEGKALAMTIPPIIGSTGKRYLGAKYVVKGTNTSGKVSTTLIETVQDGMKIYPTFMQDI